jgi:hypothetical protein
MYTVLFHRERGDDNENYHASEGEFCMENFESLSEVERYVMLKTSQQEHMQRGDRIQNNRKYYYGTYGFAVLKNGVLISNDWNFEGSFNNCSMPSVEEIELDCNSIQYKAVQYVGDLYTFTNNYIDIEEKYLAQAKKDEKERIRLAKKSTEERALLKELLAKYPDMR